MTLRSWIARKHFVFELITMLSVLEREERWGIYTVLILLLLMVTYTTVVFLPGHLRHLAGTVMGV